MTNPSKYPMLSKFNSYLSEGRLDELRSVLFRLNEDERSLLEAELGAEGIKRLFRTARKRRGPKHGRVVVIHGIMGGLLDSIDSKGDSDRIWVNFWRLFKGRLDELELTLGGAPAKPEVNIKVSGIHKLYLPLIFELQSRWLVKEFFYDWRVNIDNSAQQLADCIQHWAKDEPVHIVAHSMGGLVARRFIQTYPQVWESMKDPDGSKQGGRLIMLGTPNYGSYAIPLTLSGKEKQVKALALLDKKHKLPGLLKIIATFYGSYQMLPSAKRDFGDDHVKLFKESSWGKYPVHQELLTRAERFHAYMFEVIDPDNLIYIAGYDQSTPDGIRIVSPGKFKYRMSEDGDGRVPHRLGLLEGVRTYWVRESHSKLVQNDFVLDNIHELLLAGVAPLLETDRPLKRILSVEEEWMNPEEFEDIPAELKEILEPVEKTTRGKIPKLDDLEIARAESLLFADYLGIDKDTKEVKLDKLKPPSAPSAKPMKSKKPLTINVEVEWGDIRNAEGDVFCIGHYQGVLPQRAEWKLDTVLSAPGAKDDEMLLNSLTRKGLLKGVLGEVNFYPWAGPKYKGRLVAVAGMGFPGTFSEGRLRQLAKSLAGAVGSLPDARTVCTVLIGSGEGGLISIETAAKNLISGMFDAFRIGLRSAVRKIKIVELQYTKAHEILFHLNSLKKMEEGLELNVISEVSVGKGGRISDEHGLALVLAAAAKASTRIPDSPKKDTPLETVLSEIPEEQHQHNSALRAISTLSESGVKDLGKLARSIHVDLEDEDGDEKDQDIPLRLSYIKDSEGIHVAAINDTTVVPERNIKIDFSLVKELTLRTTDPAPEDLADLSTLLNRLLVPRDFREIIQFYPPMIFELNRSMAGVHWELLACQIKDEPCPYIGLRTSVSRQLRTEYSPPPEPRQRTGEKRRALVIGDPGDPKKRHDLPGARLEAERVYTLLREKGFDEVVLRIGAPTPGRKYGPISGVPPASRLEVLRLLYEGDFDLLHYAGHGDFDPHDPARVGWVFKDGLLTAREFETLDRAPQLIFANACLSSRTSEVLAGGRHVGEIPSEADLLPSLADEFFRRGVRNYIGAAWEIDDQGAIEFTETFYKYFLADLDQSKKDAHKGLSIGKALLKARNALYEKRALYGSLWLSYQHYGDPQVTME